MGSSEEDPERHPIFTKEPSEWMQYVYREVSVTVSNGKQYTGWVYTVDPVSESIVLVQFRPERNPSVTLIMGHSVHDITMLHSDVEQHRAQLDGLFRPQAAVQYTEEQLEERREKLKAWLCKNRVPVEESPDDKKVLSISNALFIHPPYDPGNCQSTNEIILEKTQNLIKSMPSDSD